MALPQPATAPHPEPARVSPVPVRRPAGPTWPQVLRSMALVALLHAVVLGAWPGAPADDPPRAVPSVQVRTLAPVPEPMARAPAVEAQAVTLPVAGPSVPAGPRAGPPAVPVAAPDPEVPAPPEALPVASAEPASAPAGPELPVPAGGVAVAELASPALAPDPPVPPDVPATPAQPAKPAPLGGAPTAGPLPLADTGEPLPVYPARPAPSQTLGYQLRRGLLGGSAVLEWHRTDAGQGAASYRLRLVARAAGFVVLTQESEGDIDAGGLAPRRFTDQRLRGSVRAANLQRERGRIGFSGPAVEYAWAPGVQDRLSWMLQLPAIVDANPRLAAPGERITLAVVGARGDAAVWVFRFVAEEPVSTPAGERRALKFMREPRKPHDTQAEVWLDPDHHHLPLRARIGNPPDGDVLDLLREEP